MQLQTHSLPDMIVADHEFRLPLDHDAPDNGRITVFAREAVAPDRQHDDLPWLVFFQGGPGNESPRPTTRSGWLKVALGRYRVLLLDQRGTGLSSPVTHQTLARFGSPQAQADYLKHFRADSIVRDAEAIRRELIGEAGRWSVLGQSFGGFCVTHYLSAAPEGLREAVITGGLPPLERPAEDVYRATYRRVLDKNSAYYERYPADARVAREIVDHLAEHDVRLPTGDRLTPHRFQQLGLHFGMSDGFDKIHYLLETAFVQGPAGPAISYKFLREFENLFTFETNPIFAILHEPIYCQEAASNWAAQRVRAEFPRFEIKLGGEPIFFTGEMIYPWMFDEMSQLRPLKEAAEILAAYDGWPRLYDTNILRGNSVPCAAAVYYNDAYVEREFSEETAQSIRGIRLWITNEYEHNGLRADGEAVLGRLLGMLHPLP
jgi:pimeloyl-ACP methyl ester carboxylesterase